MPRKLKSIAQWTMDQPSQNPVVMTPYGPGVVLNPQPEPMPPSLQDYFNNSEARTEARYEEQQLFRACMYQRGWRREEQVIQ